MRGGPDKVLVCAATVMEMEACLAGAGWRFPELEPCGDRPWARSRGRLVLAITGVGIPMTLARLLPLASGLRPDLIFNAGIAGAYPGSGFSIGDRIAAESECFGDLGMESPGPEAFLPLAGFPWADEAYRGSLPMSLEPFGEGRTGMPAPASARGCTVNACTGTEATGGLRRILTGAAFESMEGAAAALAGRELGIPVCELRAVSNIASTRNITPAGVEMALGSLGAYLGSWLERHA